jgi:hypothetical protein
VPLDEGNSFEHVLNVLKVSVFKEEVEMRSTYLHGENSGLRPEKLKERYLPQKHEWAREEQAAQQVLLEAAN